MESYFRQTKETLGFDRYRIRHERAIKRFWAIVQFTYIYCMTEHSSDFSTGLASVRSRKIHNLIEFIYYEAQRGMLLDSIKKTSYEWHKGIFVCFLKIIISVSEQLLLDEIFAFVPFFIFEERSLN
ncbi:hypothetical protein [Aeribacillus sp. FSL W8-0870]|uniref:hypothetical protein n=1 Tax=unclassified Aeribacillus TaxID=2640495 RepID=UPI00403F6DD4